MQRDGREIEFFLNVKFPKIQRLAAKLGADIAFQDESGVGVMTRHGRTWGLRGKTPVVKASMKRGGFNILSTVTAQGGMRYSVKEGSIDGGVESAANLPGDVVKGQGQGAKRCAHSGVRSC